MSEGSTNDPVELTRRAIASLDSRNFDALMCFVGPASVCDLSFLELGTHTGSAAIRRFAVEWVGRLPGYAVQLREMQDFGNGVIYVAAVGHRAYAPHFHIDLPDDAVLVWTDGILDRFTLYADADEARAAAEALARERG